MPDRRQHDRRESGLGSKKLSMTLGNFIMVCIIFVIIIVSIILCNYFYYKGYNECLDDNFLFDEYYENSVDDEGDFDNSEIVLDDGEIDDIDS